MPVKKGEKSKSMPGHKDYETHKGDKDYHRMGHDVKGRPYMKNGMKDKMTDKMKHDSDAKSKKKSDDKMWIQKVDSDIKRRGTEGVFTAKAKKHGMSVHEYARKVVKELKGKEGMSKSEETLLKQAVLALNFEKIARKNKKQKNKEE